MGAMKEVKLKVDEICKLCASTNCYNCTMHIKLDNGDSVELYDKKIVKVTKGE